MKLYSYKVLLKEMFLGKKKSKVQKVVTLIWHFKIKLQHIKN